MPASILIAAHANQPHPPADGILQHRSLTLIRLTANDTDRFNTVLMPQGRQRMQVIGPGAAKRYQARSTQLFGLREIRVQFEGFVAGRETAAAIEAQQTDIPQ